MRLDQGAALDDEVVRHLVQRVLVRDARRDRLADEHVLMELLAIPQRVGDERDADRAAGIARGVEHGRGLVGLAGWKPVVGRRGDRRKERRKSNPEPYPRLREEPEAKIAIDIGEDVHRKRREYRADYDQVLGLGLGRQAADNG